MDFLWIFGCCVVYKLESVSSHPRTVVQCTKYMLCKELGIILPTVLSSCVLEGSPPPSYLALPLPPRPRPYGFNIH
jgi:hypothetical protein